MDQRTVTCVILPKDIQEEAAVPEPPQQHDSVHSAASAAPCRTSIPKEPDLRRGGEDSQRGQEGRDARRGGALAATDEVIQIAELLGAGHRQELARQGGRAGRRAVLRRPHRPARHQAKLGHDAGLRHAARRRLQLSRTASSIRRQGKAKGVQIDIDGRMLSLRYPMDVNLKGDAKQTLQALMPLIDRKPDRSWQETIIEETRRVVEGRRGAGDERRPTAAQPRARLLGTEPAGCPTTASSPPTAARPPTGTPAI